MSKDLRNGGLDRLTEEDIRRPGFSTPWDAPTVPPYPFAFRDVEILTLVWRTTAAAVARLLPPPLEPTSDVVMAHIYKMNDTDWLGPYGESNVSVGCRLPGVVHGRELHGQPKKYGEPTLELRGDLMVGRVTRNGIDVLTGAAAAVRAVLPGMLAAGRGTIVNLSSGAAHRPLEGWSAYCAGKAGLAMLTRSIALEYGASAIRAFGFAPGLVDTEMQADIRASGLNPVSAVPQSALSDPAEPARAIAYLCSPAAIDLAGVEIDIRDPAFRRRAGLSSLED